MSKADSCWGPSMNTALTEASSSLVHLPPPRCVSTNVALITQFYLKPYAITRSLPNKSILPWNIQEPLNSSPSVIRQSPQTSPWALVHRPSDTTGASCCCTFLYLPLSYSYSRARLSPFLLGRPPHLLLYAPGELLPTYPNVLLSRFTCKLFVDTGHVLFNPEA